jgi:hypothetical protein
MPTMARDNMFCNGQSKTSAPHLPRAAFIGPVESLGQARNLRRGDPFTLIDDSDGHAGIFGAGYNAAGCDFDPDRGFRSPIINGIGDEILKNLGEFIGLARNVGERLGNDEVDLHASFFCAYGLCRCHLLQNGPKFYNVFRTDMFLGLDF